MSIPKSEFEKVIQAVATAKDILITGTASPDGDSIGSQLALREILLQLNPKTNISVINEVACPERYRFLKDQQTITPFKQSFLQAAAHDVGFVLDGGSERAGLVKPIFERCRTKVLVDHHLYGSNESYDLHLRDPKSSSTAEIVYSFYEVCQNKVKLTQAMAAQLYLAIIFDTGFFRFSLTTPRTMRIGADLIATGIDFPKIAATGMVERTVAGRKLLGHVLSNFKLERSGKLAWTQISRALIKKFKAQDDDHEGIIENICYTNGVEVAFLLLELPKQEVKVSFRSRQTVDVGTIARSLGGGGHARAAGCSFFKTGLSQVLKQVRSAIPSRF